MVDWNPFSHPCVDNPFPIYRHLRNEQPVYHNERMGFYALSRFDDVLYGLLHPSLFKSSHGITLEGQDSPDMLLNKDDPEHIQHRKIVSPAFTVSAIAKLEPRIRSVAGQLLDEASGRTVMDVLDDFSIMMPAAIIADVVGIPQEYRMDLLEYAKQFNVAEETDDSPRPTDGAIAASMHVHEIMTHIVAEAANSPGDNVMGSLLKARNTARITLVGDYTGSTFLASSDGKGGVNIVDPGAQTPSVVHFAGAMAAITGQGGPAVGAIAYTRGQPIHDLALARPHVAFA